MRPLAAAALAALAVACGGGGGTSSKPARVRGTVTAGPSCPVQRRDHPCADEPIAITLRLVRGDGSEARRARSGGDGHYSMVVSPGRYRLEQLPVGGLPRCPTVAVQVSAGRTTRADLRCDTGIR